MSTKEKIDKLIEDLNKGSSAELFKIETRDGKQYFVLDIPNMGRFIDIPLSIPPEDNDDSADSV